MLILHSRRNITSHKLYTVNRDINNDKLSTCKKKCRLYTALDCFRAWQRKLCIRKRFKFILCVDSTLNIKNKLTIRWIYTIRTVSF